MLELSGKIFLPSRTMYRLAATAFFLDVADVTERLSIIGSMRDAAACYTTSTEACLGVAEMEAEKTLQLLLCVTTVTFASPGKPRW